MEITARARGNLGKLFIIVGILLPLIALLQNTPVPTLQRYSDRGYVAATTPTQDDTIVLATIMAEDGKTVGWRMSAHTRIGSRIGYFEAIDGRLSQSSFPMTYPYTGIILSVVLIGLLAVSGGIWLLRRRDPPGVN